MNKITLISLLCFFLIGSLGFAQNEKFEYKTRPIEYENFEYRNDSIFPLKSVTMSTESKLVFEKIFLFYFN